MRDSWRKAYWQFFRYQKSDRNAVLILGTILLLLIVVIRVMPWLMKPEPSDFSALETLVDAMESEATGSDAPSKLALFAFNPNEVPREQLDSLDLPAAVKRNILKYRQAGGRFKSRSDVRKIYGMNDSVFNAVKDYIVIPASTRSAVAEIHVSKKDVEHFTGSIDPNRDSYQRLVAFGLSEFQASNLVRYREKGGTFRHRDDLRKIYGIDSLFFAQISSHIVITHPDADTASVPETVVVPKIELNSADTTDLKALPGIGSVFAARIVKYRDLLGGFYSIRQLLEVYHFPEETYHRVEKFLTVDTTKVQQIRINFSDYSELLRHPYLQKEQVRQLIGTRDERGAFKQLEEVQALTAFDSITFSAVRPYLSCR